MTNIEKYDALFESINEKLESGELTFEQASALNDAAFAKYVESCNEGVEEDNTDSNDDVEESTKKEKEEECDCGKDDCPICNPEKKSIKKKDAETDEEAPVEDEKPKKKSIKKKDAETDEEAPVEESEGEGVPEEETTESVMPDSVKLAVFEAYTEGKITTDEMDLFITVLS